MTTTIQVSMFERGTMTERLTDIENAVKIASLAIPALGGKALRSERHRGYTTYFVRSGKTQIFTSVQDVDMVEVDPEKVYRGIVVGVHMPDVAEEKRAACAAALMLGAKYRLAVLSYAGKLVSPTGHWEKFREYDPADDVVPEVESL